MLGVAPHVYLRAALLGSIRVMSRCLWAKHSPVVPRTLLGAMSLRLVSLALTNPYDRLMALSRLTVAVRSATELCLQIRLVTIRVCMCLNLVVDGVAAPSRLSNPYNLVLVRVTAPPTRAPGAVDNANRSLLWAQVLQSDELLDISLLLCLSRAGT